ncbi:MAG TPA: hypothetical protein VEA59_07045, partial [Patescibacteria group bacterium]|nr:hypothetical protein [Patescibacteria group bacterium]
GGGGGGGTPYTYTGIPGGHSASEIESTGGCVFNLAGSRPKDKETAQLNESIFQFLKSTCAAAKADGKRLSISALTGCNGTNACSGHSPRSYHYRGCAVDFGDNPSSPNGRFIAVKGGALSGGRVNPGSDENQDNHMHVDLGSGCREAQ